jgi:hypothetical protein
MACDKNPFLLFLFCFLRDSMSKVFFVWSEVVNGDSVIGGFRYLCFHEAQGRTLGSIGSVAHGSSRSFRSVAIRPMTAKSRSCSPEMA